MRFLLAAVAAASMLISACGAATTAPVTPATDPTPASVPQGATPRATSVAPAPTVAPAGTKAPASAAPTTAVIDLSDLDVCSLLTQSDVQALTGTSLEFDDQPNPDGCFWGVPVPGQPEYVEVRVFARPTGLTGYTFNPGDGCEVAPVSGVGAEALGAVCDNPQHKVYLLATDRGVAVQVLVNEPAGPLNPEGLAELVTATLEEITIP